MSLEPGFRIGAYEIVSALGAGGMGEVYRARDTRLQRDVAVKVLVAGSSADADRLTRFEQEARATAALNHPNIVVVFDVGTHEGQPFLVSELLEGQTLRETLLPGPLPMRKAIDYAVQIATGLAAVHDKGIVHRDLKPDNVFITSDGRAKILDFGIAKLLVSPHDAETRATAASLHTDAGIVLGTAAYMSPEQIRGAAVDHRADIFALGTMLFEMLSGTRPFAGATSADAMSAVLLRDPAELVTPDGSTPPALDRLIRRCLEKAPEQRFQSARDLAFALEAITVGTGRAASAGHTAAVAATATSPWRERAAWLLLAAILSAAIVALALRPPPHHPTPPPAAPARFTLESPFKTAAVVSLSVSPDGTSLVVQARSSEAERGSLQIRRLDGAGFTEIPGTAGGRGAVWSSDSRSIAFIGDRALRKLDLGATEARLLAEMPPSLNWNSITTNPAGDFLVAFHAAPLHIVRANGNSIEPLLALDAAASELEHVGPVFLPDGRRYIYLSVRSRTSRGVTRLRSLDSDEVLDLPEFEDRILWAGDGHVILRRGTSLLAQAITYAPFALQGGPVQLAGDVTSIGVRLNIASASAGTLAYGTDRPMPQQFTWVARDGRTIGPIGPPGQYPSFDLSDDGSRLVVSQEEAGAQNIWTIDTAKGTMNRVTVGAVSDVDPRLSPDGRTVIFGSLRDPVRSPYKATISGQEPERLFGFKGRTFALDDWSRDGAWLLFHDVAVPTIQGVRLDQLAAEPVTIAKGLTGLLDQAQMSPDGKWVSYHSVESGRAEVYVVPFPPTGDKWQVSMGGGAQPLWRRDGREMYYLALDGWVMAVPIARGNTFKAGDPLRLFRSSVTTPSIVTEQYAVSPDGKRFLFAPFLETTPTPALTVLTNWQSLLTEKAQ